MRGGTVTDEPAITVSGKSAGNNANLVANGHKVMLLTTTLAKANCTTAGNTAIDTLGTALTKATHQLVKSPDNSADVTGGLATNKVFTQKWYQPKESKDKKIQGQDAQMVQGRYPTIQADQK